MSKGIQECIEHQYLVRRQVGTWKGTSQPLWAYSLNVNYEITGPENGPVEQATGPKSVPVEGSTGPKNGPATGPKSVLSKRKKVHTEEKKEDPFSSEQKKSPAAAWLTALTELRLMMEKGTFDTWLAGSRLASVDKGTWQIEVQHEYAVDWLTNRLHAHILRSVQRHNPDVTAIEFIAREGAT